MGEEDGSLRLLQEMTVVTHGNPRFCPLFAAPKTTKLILLDSLLQEAEHVARLYFQIAG